MEKTLGFIVVSESEKIESVIARYYPDGYAQSVVDAEKDAEDTEDQDFIIYEVVVREVKKVKIN